jgi:Ni,Fe-hydrogenase III large subunit/Ni,Fe-hydrogenase III component G
VIDRLTPAWLAHARRRMTIELQPEALERECERLLDNGYRLATIAGHDNGHALHVVYLFTLPGVDRRVELIVAPEYEHPELPSLASLSFPAGRFERELADLFGIEPVGHPLPRRLVHHQHWPDGWHPMRQDAGPTPTPDESREPFPFVTVEGPGVYEIPVGPVHAGLIEPGHFRFSVVGETIITMKARLWFVHKGIEKLFEGRDPRYGIELSERVSGDTAIGHSLAYCLAVEEALGVQVPVVGQWLRALLLELERLYNHAADIGGLANDVGYGIINAHAFRIRERLLRVNQRVTGHRLLRGAIVLGGAHVRDLPEPEELLEIATDLAEIASLALENATVVDRFTGTSILPTQPAAALGTLGYVARASAVDIDARRDHPFVDLSPALNVVVDRDGDVMARFRVRRDEFANSVELIRWLLGQLSGRHGEPAIAPIPAATEPSSGVGIVEAWRGTLVHRVEISPEPFLARVKIVDPSFFNWPALPVALKDTIVPDFPLTNKSFGLSYAGNDL